MCFKNRGFNLRAALQAIRLAPLAQRAQMAAALPGMAQTDQAAFALAVVAAGGAVQRHYWHLNAISVELPPAAVNALSMHPRVRSLWPVKARRAGDAAELAPRSCAPESVSELRLDCGLVGQPPAPLATTVDAWNHNVVAAWNILGTNNGTTFVPYKGAGACVAVMDSGIDIDVFDQTAALDVHPAFVVPGSPTPTTRILAHRIGGDVNHVDINSLTQNQAPWRLLGPPYSLPPHTGTSGYRRFLGTLPSGHHPACGHGTAMAGIIAGNSHSFLTADGHAPEAELVDVACSAAADATLDWAYTDDGYLGGIESLRDFILASGQKVHVVNISLFGEPSPFHPISTALDSLARDEDILLVTSAGNFGDTTLSSNGFYHGLAVGAVHARVANQNLSFVPMNQSSRGPLLENVEGRFYPDVCATGAGPGHLTTGGTPEYDYPGAFDDAGFFYSTGHPLAGLPLDSMMLMPGVDVLDPLAQPVTPPNKNRVCPVRPALGTSEAAAQVSGAAALYRGYVTTATAEETRAAILLNVVGTYGRQDGQSSAPGDQHSYTGRNTFGVGYVRDDVLASFAKRDAAVEPLVAAVELTEAAPSNQSVVYTSLTTGARYAAVACWRRHIEPLDGIFDNYEGRLANVRLEIVDHANGTVIAISDSPANSYERCAFLAPASGAVRCRVATGDVSLLSITSLAVQIVARRLQGDMDAATPSQYDHVHAGSGGAQTGASSCTQPAQDWQVDRIVPYAFAYGSAPFLLSPSSGGAVSHASYVNGFDLAAGAATVAPSGFPSWWEGVIHIEYLEAPGLPGVVGGAMNIGGISFRSWAPLGGGGVVIEEMWLGQGAWWTPPPTGGPPIPAAYGGMQVVGGNGRTVAVASAGAAGRLPTTRGLSDFSVVVPFDNGVVFPYAGTQTLHLWIKVQVPMSPPLPTLLVDGTDDGSSVVPDVEAHRALLDPFGGPTQTFTLPGRAPILGLIESSAFAAREVRLVISGEPWSSTSAASPQAFDVLMMSGLPNSIAVLFAGMWNPTPVVAPPACTTWLSTTVSSWGAVTDPFGIARWAVSLPPNGVHATFGLQAVVFNSSQPNATPTLSQGQLIHVGGGL